jgi:hypothetical protein
MHADAIDSDPREDTNSQHSSLKCEQAAAEAAQLLVNTGLTSVPVLSAKFSCSISKARRMLT